MSIWRRYRTFWRDVYCNLNFLGMLVFLPSIVVLYPILAIAGMIEFFMLDIPYLIAARIEFGSDDVRSKIKYLYWS